MYSTKEINYTFNATIFIFQIQAYSDGTSEFPGSLLPEQDKKKGRNKRPPKGGEKPARYKKRKKEGDDRQLIHSGPDAVMTQIKQVRLLYCFLSSSHIFVKQLKNIVLNLHF